MENKTCKKCGDEKPLAHFYKHPKTADGRAGSCKECNKAATRENRKKNADYYREYDAKRFQDDPKVRARHKRYQATPAGKESVNKSRKKWRAENPDKRAAHVILGNAVRDGRAFKPDTCDDCERTGKLHGHHEDYSKPLDVDWLCPTCHRRRHA